MFQEIICPNWKQCSLIKPYGFKATNDTVTLTAVKSRMVVSQLILEIFLLYDSERKKIP